MRSAPLPGPLCRPATGDSESLLPSQVPRQVCLHRNRVVCWTKPLHQPNQMNPERTGNLPVCLAEATMIAMQAREQSMASLTIRNIDDALKTRLRIRAAERGHSMEAEARRILR